MDETGIHKLNESHTVPAEYFSTNQVFCRLPRPHSYMVDVSNDGELTSGVPTPAVQYDPVCHHCERLASGNIVCQRNVSIIHTFSKIHYYYMDFYGNHQEVYLLRNRVSF